MNNDPQWVPIARLANLADAGFFEATLVELGIDARIEQRDEFDAVAGHWQPVFVLQVAASDTKRATEALEQQLQASSAATGDGSGQDPEETDGRSVIELQPPWSMADTDEADGWTLWRPFLLIVLAAGLVYLAVRTGKPGGGGAQRPADIAPLWNTLIESREPLRSAHRELWYDSRRRRLIVIDDVDGDGVADILREFENGRLVREADIERPGGP